MAKRGTNDWKHGNREVVGRKKVQNKGRTWKNNRTPAQTEPVPLDHSLHVQNQLDVSDVAAPLGCNHSCSLGMGQGSSSLPGFAPPFSQPTNITRAPQQFLVPCCGGWTNGMEGQQQQQAFFPNGFPLNSMRHAQNNPRQHQILTTLPNVMPFQQQFDPNQRFLPNMGVSLGQPNLFSAPTSMHWPGLVDQVGFSQAPFNMGLQGHHFYPSINLGEQGAISNGLGEGQQFETPSPSGISQPFNPGASSGRGRKPYWRGRGYFAGKRGGRQSK